MESCETFVKRQFAPLLVADVNGVMEVWLEALTAPFAGLEEIADSDTHGGHGILYDVDECPAWALTWLGQHAGVLDIERLAEADQRIAIRTRKGISRGGVDALIAAAQRRLTGNKTVFVRQFYQGERWRILVATRTTETPEPTKTEADIMAAKLIGIKLTYVVADGFTWQELADAYTDFDEVASTYTDFDELAVAA